MASPLGRADPADDVLRRRVHVDYAVPRLRGVLVVQRVLVRVGPALEGLLAVRFLGADHLVAELGGGMGLVPGVGSADYRLFLSIGGRSMPAPVVEEVIIIDPCADTPEDMDGFEDANGCPEEAGPPPAPARARARGR